MSGLTVAVTADLHFGLSPEGDRATRRLLERLEADPPDVLILAGDTGVRESMEKGLRVFRHLPSVKLLTAGNHDLWAVGEGGDSLEIYSHEIAETASDAGFRYLDDGPWIAPDRSLAVVGSVNWYDYSLASEKVLAAMPKAMEMFRKKMFLKARHNDGRYVKLGMTDEEFTGLVVDRVAEHLAQAGSRAEAILLATHHPPVPELFKPLSDEPSYDELIWTAYSGNARMRDLVHGTEKLRYVFCGHTHAYRRERVGKVEAVNVGSDYGEKALAILRHPAGSIEMERFGGEARRD